MFTAQQLTYFESQAIPQSMAKLGQFAQVIRQLQGGDALGNPLPNVVKENLEAQGVLMFSKLAQAFAELSQSIATLRVGDSSLIDLIIPPVVETPPPSEPPA